jgi:hypothetical protein
MATTMSLGCCLTLLMDQATRGHKPTRSDLPSHFMCCCMLRRTTPHVFLRGSPVLGGTSRKWSFLTCSAHAPPRVGDPRRESVSAGFCCGVAACVGTTRDHRRKKASEGVRCGAHYTLGRYSLSILPSESETYASCARTSGTRFAEQKSWGLVTASQSTKLSATSFGGTPAAMGGGIGGARAIGEIGISW